MYYVFSVSFTVIRMIIARFTMLCFGLISKLTLALFHPNCGFNVNLCSHTTEVKKTLFPGESLRAQFWRPFGVYSVSTLRYNTLQESFRPHSQLKVN